MFAGMGQVHLVRHGQAAFGASDYDQLSPLGLEQARLLGGWFADCGTRFTRAVMGTLARHRQTAEACLAALPPALRPEASVEIDAGLDEYDHDELLRRHRPDFDYAALAAADNPRRAFQELFRQAMARWMGGAHDADYREPWRAFRSRCLAALGRIVGAAGSSQSVVVFTSGGPIAAMCQELLGLTDARAAELNYALVNSGVTRLLYQPGRVSLSVLNGFPHLERAGRAEVITYR